MIAPVGIARAYEILDKMESAQPPGGPHPEFAIAKLHAQAAHVQAIAAVHQAQATQLQAVAAAYAADAADPMFSADERKQVRATIRNLMGFDLVYKPKGVQS